MTPAIRNTVGAVAIAGAGALGGGLFMTAQVDTLQHEGGYVNDPADSGGETNYGITLETARRFGYEGDIRAIPDSVVADIYYRGYWQPNRLDEVALVTPDTAYLPVATRIYDAGVNMGPGTSAGQFQRCLNAYNYEQRYYPDLTIDRAVGPRTLRSLDGYVRRRGSAGQSNLYACLCAVNFIYYLELVERRPKDERFMTGWTNRLREEGCFPTFR